MSRAPQPPAPISRDRGHYRGPTLPEAEPRPAPMWPLVGGDCPALPPAGRCSAHSGQTGMQVGALSALPEAFPRTIHASGPTPLQTRAELTALAGLAADPRPKQAACGRAPGPRKTQEHRAKGMATPPLPAPSSGPAGYEYLLLKGVLPAGTHHDSWRKGDGCQQGEWSVSKDRLGGYCPATRGRTTEHRGPSGMNVAPHQITNADQLGARGWEQEEVTGFC